MTTDELKRCKERVELLGRIDADCDETASGRLEWAIYRDDFCQQLLSGPADDAGRVKAACELLTFAPLLVAEVERLQGMAAGLYQEFVRASHDADRLRSSNALLHEQIASRNICLTPPDQNYGRYGTA